MGDQKGEHALLNPGPEGAPPKDEDPELKINGGKYDSKFAFWQVTIRLPLDMNGLNELAILYGYLPFLIPGGLGIAFLITWHFLYLYGVLISIVLVCINEAVLKKLCDQPRPDRTAHRDKDGKPKHGMPSGHVLNSTSIMVWSLLEVYLRGPTQHNEEHVALTGIWLAAIFLAMFPVPWARWYNGDHSAAQCSVSLVLGLFVGIGAFLIRVHYFDPAWKPWSEQTGQRPHQPILNFYRPPWVASTAAPETLLL